MRTGRLVSETRASGSSVAYLSKHSEWCLASGPDEFCRHLGAHVCEIWTEALESIAQAVRVRMRMPMKGNSERGVCLPWMEEGSGKVWKTTI